MMKTDSPATRARDVEFADETYFAGANTADGFHSFYDTIFDERSLTRLILIKGGPGSGKSTLMRRFIRDAKSNGLTTKAYLCGSDPFSLDAAVICGKGTVAMIDATSPHAYDARYPGAVATVFDCGAFWDESALASHRETISALCDAKTAAYRRAYRYLASLGTVRRDLRALGEDALDMSKMTAACRRYARSLRSMSKNGDGQGISRCASCFSMRGRYSLDPFADYTTVTVTDSANTSSMFFKILSEQLRAEGITVISLSDSIEVELSEGLILPDHRIRILLASNTEGVSEKNFNLARFVRRDVLSASRNKRDFGRRCAESLADGAVESLESAGECHFALENIYVAAMDFDALNSASQPLLERSIDAAK